MIHFPKEMVSRSEKFGTVPVFHLIRKDGGVVVALGGKVEGNGGKWLMD